MTKVNWKELKKEIQDKPTWNNTLYKTKITDLGNAKPRIIYNDGSIVEEWVNYPKASRTNVKSISIIDENNNPLHTVPVKDDYFIIKSRVLRRGLVPTGEPKRTVILATKGKIDFVWDDGDIDELTDWGDEEPYTKPNLREEEK